MTKGPELIKKGTFVGLLKKAGRSSQPRDAPPAHVARAALFAPHGGRDGPGHGELGGGAGLLAAR